MNALAINKTNSYISALNVWDHLLARWGYRRMNHRVEPGIYTIGSPTAESPVLVTSNYTLSFDALRSSLNGENGYILALDTQGVNVWCAAGKGTFGTRELVNRIEKTNLEKIVSHRTLILPQLGAPGVSAHDVKKSTGFKIEYGPVRAKDLPEYLKNRQATPEMRRVQFNIADRAAVIPVDVVAAIPIMIILGLAFYFLAGGLWAAIGIVAAILSGSIIFPLVLPWLPTRDFSSKGFILGAVIAIVIFIMKIVFQGNSLSDINQILKGISNVLMFAPVTAFVSLNFTGSTTFTSRSGVRSEIKKYIRPMAIIFVAGIIVRIITLFI